MSHKVNEEWLEAAKENFDTCVEGGDYQGCLSVISDMRSYGFSVESLTFRDLLNKVPLSRFAKRSEWEY